MKNFNNGEKCLAVHIALVAAITDLCYHLYTDHGLQRARIGQEAEDMCRGAYGALGAALDAKWEDDVKATINATIATLDDEHRASSRRN